MTSQITIIGNSWLSASIAFSLMVSVPSRKIMLFKDMSGDHDHLSDLEDSTFLTESKFLEFDPDTAGKSKVIIYAYEWANIDKNEEGAREAMETYKQVTLQLKNQFTKDTILLVASYPTDVFTKFILHWSDLSPYQVLGIGTMLDSVRLRHKLANNYEVSQLSLPVFVYGKERDNTLISWLSAPEENEESLSFRKFNKDSMRMFAMRNGNKVVQEKDKNFNQYGITACTVNLCNCITRDERRLRSVSYYQPEYDVCMSLPCTVSEKGVVRFTSFKFDEDDLDLIQDVVKSIKTDIERYKALITTI